MLAFERVLPEIESLAENFASRYRSEIESIGLGKLPDRGEIQRETERLQRLAAGEE